MNLPHSKSPRPPASQRHLRQHAKDVAQADPAVLAKSRSPNCLTTTGIDQRHGGWSSYAK